jgi:hypothetical protein
VHSRCQVHVLHAPPCTLLAVSEDRGPSRSAFGALTAHHTHPPHTTPTVSAPLLCSGLREQDERYILGGFNLLSDNVTTFKDYENAPEHVAVRVRLFAYAIDVWGPNSSYAVTVDGEGRTFDNALNNSTEPRDPTNVAIRVVCGAVTCPLGCGFFNATDYNRTVDFVVHHRCE